MAEAVAAAVVTHGGAGAEKSWEDGCRGAAHDGLSLLIKGETALAAAIQAAVLLEDDGRFNAGTGSRLRLDGKTVEMDAAVMDSLGNLAAVAAITGVKNPVLVAREILETPHVFLAGQGAVDFARQRGFPLFDTVSAVARESYRRAREALARGDYSDVAAEWRNFNLPAYWNFPEPLADAWTGCDTIGAVARDQHCNFAAAVSTGGSSPMLRGRVGDTPLVGCGFYAGVCGAVAVTGIGEAIIRRMLARDIYDHLARGMAAQDACESGVSLFPQAIPVGIIAVAAGGTGVASNRPMPTAVAES